MRTLISSLQKLLVYPIFFVLAFVVANAVAITLVCWRNVSAFHVVVVIIIVVVVVVDKAPIVDVIAALDARARPVPIFRAISAIFAKSMLLTNPKFQIATTRATSNGEHDFPNFASTKSCQK